MSKQFIISHFNEIAELQIQAASELAGPIEQAIELMFTSLSNGNRILACGNGSWWDGSSVSGYLCRRWRCLPMRLS